MDLISIDLIFEILEYCSASDICQLVQTSTKLARLDQYDYHWELKIDKLGLPGNLLKHWSPLKLYCYLQSAQTISVYSGNDVFKTYMYRGCVEYAIEHVKTMVPNQEYSIILFGLKMKEHGILYDRSASLSSVMIYTSDKNKIIYKSNKDVDTIMVYPKIIPTVEKFRNSLVKEKLRGKQKLAPNFLAYDMYHAQILKYICEQFTQNGIPIYGYLDMQQKLYLIEKCWDGIKLRGSNSDRYTASSLINILGKFGVQTKGTTVSQLCQEIQEVLEHRGHLLKMKYV